LVRLAFDQNEPQHACVALRRALQDVPATEVELHNQLDYFSPRCVNVDSTRAVGTAHTAASRASARRDSAATTTARRDTTPAPRASKARYTLQVAAYGSKA